ncbi:MAG: protein translocase subunit SecD, partial [Rhodospirillaceae bacterium]|nr:protein translocase subunit SecD [Rhodospirillaceae bacterium]
MLQFPAWKIWIVAIVCGLGVAFAMPNVLPRDVAESLPSWMPNKQISLGLDLSGGAHLVVQIDEQAYVDGRLESVGQNIRRTLRAEQIGVRATGIVGMTVSFDLRKLEDIAAAREEIGVIADDFIVVVNDDGTITAILTEQGLEIG